MTLLECERAARQATGTPSSISWRSVGEMVQISVEVSNDSSEQTVPDTLVIEAAAFGAFIPTVPIARIAVDALDPGERREITTTVSRTLLDSTTQDASSEAARDRITEIFNSFVQASAGSQWIGNLNVYFDRASDKAVERHCAFDLKVPTGTTILAAFLVRDDRCTFRARCSDDAWSAEVVAFGSLGAAQLFVRTPGDPGKTARVTVDVTRTLDGKVVPVEFEFETVSGCGETLGCINV
jgi:hypothetical protein